jgi:hypothetical protein
VVLVTFAETKVTQGAGRSNPQLVFERRQSRHNEKPPKGGFVIQTLDPGLRRGDDKREKTYSTVTDFARFRG